MIIATVTLISLTLMITGIVLKNALLLLSSTMTWIIFAFLMFGETFDNSAMNTGLLMFGGAMAFITAFMAIGIWVPGRKGASPESEQESYRRKVLKATKRRK